MVTNTIAMTLEAIFTGFKKKFPVTVNSKALRIKNEFFFSGQ